jgi:hypothetical protein
MSDAGDCQVGLKYHCGGFNSRLSRRGYLFLSSESQSEQLRVINLLVLLPEKPIRSLKLIRERFHQTLFLHSSDGSP